MTKKITKADLIRALLKRGLSSAEVAERVGVTTQRVCHVRWTDQRPGYNAQWMRIWRADPDNREPERLQQRDYARTRYQTDPAHRRRVRDYQKRYRREKMETRF